MAAECTFILPSGKKCRCMANRHHKFCRHHGAPWHPSPTGDRPWSRLACWRDTVRALSTYPKEAIPDELLQILYSLFQGVISDRTAGRILRTLMQRYGDVPLAASSEGLLSQTAPASAPKASGGITLPNFAEMDEAALERFVAQLTRNQSDPAQAPVHGRH